MSLINFIQKIQKKPRYLRIQILCLAVFVSMIFIVSIWVVSLKRSLPGVVEKAETPLTELRKQVPSLKETLKASIGAFFKDDLEKELEKLDKQINADNQKEIIEQFEKRPEKIKPAKLPLSS